jgi:hypothetical protein
VNRQLTGIRYAEFAGMHSTVTFDGKKAIKAAGAVKACQIERLRLAAAST